QNRDETQYEEANVLTFFADRLAYVVQEVDQIGYRSIELFRCHATGSIHVLKLAMGSITTGTYHVTLQFVHDIGHTYVREHHVVDTPATGIIGVEGTQVGIQPLRTAHTTKQRQRGWCSTEPCLGIVR